MINPAYISRGRGLGADGVPREIWCRDASAWNPLAWFMCIDIDAANVYQTATYGDIPTPATLPLPPAPNAPSTEQEMLPGGWTEQQGYTTPEQWAAYTQSQRDAMNAAVASGEWHPQGFWDSWGGPALLAAGVVGVLLLEKR